MLSVATPLSLYLLSLRLHSPKKAPVSFGRWSYVACGLSVCGWGGGVKEGVKVVYILCFGESKQRGEIPAGPEMNVICRFQLQEAILKLATFSFRCFRI